MQRGAACAICETEGPLVYVAMLMTSLTRGAPHCITHESVPVRELVTLGSHPPRKGRGVAHCPQPHHAIHDPHLFSLVAAHHVTQVLRPRGDVRRSPSASMSGKAVETVDTLAPRVAAVTVASKTDPDHSMHAVVWRGTKKVRGRGASAHRAPVALALAPDAVRTGQHGRSSHEVAAWNAHITAACASHADNC